MIIYGREIDGRILSNYNMCDIHMHIIPEVDDGAWSMEMAEDMLRISIMQGIRKIIATPHSFAFNEKGDYVRSQFDKLKERAEEKYPEVTLYYGCEVACQPYAMKDILEKLADGRLPSICGTRYVLTEFKTSTTQEKAFSCVDELIQTGWIPVIAHIERYPKLFEDETTIIKLKEKGCLIQINVYSIKEEENETIRNNARNLIRKKQVDFLGSDAHKTYHRPPRVEAGLAYLYETCEKDYVDQIAYHNPIRYFHL